MTETKAVLPPMVDFVKDQIEETNDHTTILDILKKARQVTEEYHKFISSPYLLSQKSDFDKLITDFEKMIKKQESDEEPILYSMEELKSEKYPGAQEVLNYHNSNVFVKNPIKSMAAALLISAVATGAFIGVFTDIPVATSITIGLIAAVIATAAVAVAITRNRRFDYNEECQLQTKHREELSQANNSKKKHELSIQNSNSYDSLWRDMSEAKEKLSNQAVKNATVDSIRELQEELVKARNKIYLHPESRGEETPFVDVIEELEGSAHAVPAGQLKVFCKEQLEFEKTKSSDERRKEAMDLDAEEQAAKLCANGQDDMIPLQTFPKYHRFLGGSNTSLRRQEKDIITNDIDAPKQKGHTDLPATI